MLLDTLLMLGDSVLANPRRLVADSISRVLGRLREECILLSRSIDVFLFADPHMPRAAGITAVMFCGGINGESDQEVAEPLGLGFVRESTYTPHEVFARRLFDSGGLLFQ